MNWTAAVRIFVLVTSVTVTAGENDDWTAQVRAQRMVVRFSPKFQRFFQYECPEVEGGLHNCFQNAVLLTDRSAEFAYSAYTPLTIEYPQGSRPFLEKVVASVIGDAKDEKTKVGRLLAWLPSYRPLPEYTGPLPTVVVDMKPGEKNFDYYYRNPEEWVILHGVGDCASHARVFVILCQIVGIPARIVQLQYNHTVAEAYLDGKWSYCDALYGKMLFHKEGGNPASAWEICQGRKVVWGRVGVPLQDPGDVEQQKHWDGTAYLAVFRECGVGNYGYVPSNRREALPFFGVAPLKDGLNWQKSSAAQPRLQLPGPWSIGRWKPYSSHPDFAAIEGAKFSGRGALSVELVGRYGGRNTVGIFFGGKGPQDGWGFVLYECYGVKLFRCSKGDYKDLAAADFPTKPGIPYTLGVTADGKKIAGFIDGQRVIEAEEEVTAGDVALFNCVEARATFRNLNLYER
jgi:hypothetical protein